MTTTRFIENIFFSKQFWAEIWLMVDLINVEKLKSGKSKFIRHFKIATLIQPGTANKFICPIYLNVLELVIKYLYLLPDKGLLPLHSETTAIKNNFQKQ